MVEDGGGWWRCAPSSTILQNLHHPPPPPLGLRRLQQQPDLREQLARGPRLGDERHVRILADGFSEVRRGKAVGQDSHVAFDTKPWTASDRKSKRLNSSHVEISD